MPFANTAPLRREIESRLPDRPFTVVTASLTTAVAGALRQRGVTEPAASLAAESAVIVFKTAYARWASDPAGPELSQLIHEALGQLHAMGAPAAAPAPAAS